MSSRPLERLPTIRAKLGSTIIFAVGMTVILIFLMLGYALRKSSQDTDRLTLLRVARRAAAGTLTNAPGDISVIRTGPDGATLSTGEDAPALPVFTDGMVHVGSTGELEYAVVPLVRSGAVVELVYAVHEAPGEGLLARALQHDLRAHRADLGHRQPRRPRQHGTAARGGQRQHQQHHDDRAQEVRRAALYQSGDGGDGHRCDGDHELSAAAVEPGYSPADECGQRNRERDHGQH